MKKKHITLFALFILMGITLGIQSNRIERHKTRYSQLELVFNQYKLDQADELLKEVERENKKRLEERRKADEKINSLQSDLNASAVSRTESDRLRQQAEQHLRQIQQSTNRNDNQEANKALGVCTDLYTQLDRRSEEMERRAFIYSEYADRLEIELDACIAVGNKGRISPL